MAEISESYLANLERTIVASIIFDPSGFDEILDQLEVGDFFYPSYREIFQVCKTLHLQGNPLDEEFIRNKMDSRVVSEEEFVYILATNPIANIEAYIKELKNASLKRELHKLANTLREQSLSAELNSLDILEVIEKQIYEISTKSATTDFRDSRAILDSVLSRLQEVKEAGNQEVTGSATGFIELDRATTGFNKGDLVIIGARPSMGKTTLFLNMVTDMLKHAKGVAVFSLEMPAEQLMLRMLSALSSVPLQKLKIGDLDERELEELSSSVNFFEGRDFYVDDGSALNITQLRSKLRKLKSRNPHIDVAVIDYLQLMNGSGSKDRHLEVSEISRGLKMLARELEIPIIALSQLNRSLESRDDKRPILSDLRESGSIEQDADIILFLYRDDVYNERENRNKIAKLEKEGKSKEANEARKQLLNDYKKAQGIYPAEIIIAKNRNGETKEVRIQFNKAFTRFENIASGEQTQSYVPTKDYTPEGDRDSENVSMPGF